MQRSSKSNNHYKEQLANKVTSSTNIGKPSVNNFRPEVSKVNNFGKVKADTTTDFRSKDFEFKYVTESELQAAVKQVRRARLKKLDEEKWQHFLRWKTSESTAYSEDNDSYQFCRGTISPKHDLAHPPVEYKPERFQEMPKVEDEIQENFKGMTALPLGASISVSDSIGHAYQLGGVLTKRLQDLVATVGRMTSLLLSSVSSRSTNYEDEDVDRAIKRSVEFDAMFARNHLYEIKRLLKDAKQLVVGKCPGELDSKLSAALKCVIQAIQVYAKHVSKGARVKYQQVVPIFQSISTIQSLLEQLTGQVGFPFRQELEVACSYMKQVLLEMSTSDTQRVTTVVSRKPVRPKSTVGHKPSADLSMYNRRRPDWRRKTASLARAKFGPPSSKKNAAAKEVPHRRATMAVTEDNVTTMMEIITDEPIEDEELCLDDSAFEVLKKLNGNIAPLPDNVESQKFPKEEKTKCESARPLSAKAEPKNVQLICLREDDRPTPSTAAADPLAVIHSEIEDTKTTLTIDAQEKVEADEFHKKMNEYRQTKPHYKDGKALTIVDRLANHILAEIVMDFQKEEINNVIQMLYKLEFQ
ncbi:uncharacterized protein LOC129005358 isoform X2 [Macrosteles quadrilineatus]|uniref:uncharacterized protein LOC129005358 isoform X2 n=1 Tax=Macrosteles quadrilineatus TaxID=74068 RepID=UPI0023E1EC22|nr:uncharacterized protein LOC129005358 isoform X2 [Macrosteles quadrilineatus]